MRRHQACVGIWTHWGSSMLCVLLLRRGLMVLGWSRCWWFSFRVMPSGLLVRCLSCFYFQCHRLLLFLWDVVHCLCLFLHLRWCCVPGWCLFLVVIVWVLNLGLCWSSQIRCCQLGGILSIVWCSNFLWSTSHCHLCLGRWVVLQWFFLQFFCLFLVLLPLFCSFCALGHRLVIGWCILLQWFVLWCLSLSSCPGRRYGRHQCRGQQFPISKFLVDRQHPSSHFSFGWWLIWAWCHLLLVIPARSGWVFLMHSFCCCFSSERRICFLLCF